MIRLALALALSLLVGPAFAFSGGAQAPDPFTGCMITGTFDPSPNNGVSGKTLASSVIDTTKINVVLIIAGQSLNANSVPTPYTPTNTGHVFNINIENGANYAAVDPLLGTSLDNVPPLDPPGNGNFAGRLADALINAGTIQNVYLVPIAIGGSSSADWSTGLLGSGCQFHTRFAQAYNRLAAKGIIPGLTNTTFVILWGQGEADNCGTSQAQYTINLNTIITASRSAGFTQGSVPWFVNTETWSNGTTCAAVVAAQAAAVNHPTNIWAGFNMDSLNATFRQSDDTHLADNGAAAYVTGLVTQLHAFGFPF